MIQDTQNHTGTGGFEQGNGVTTMPRVWRGVEIAFVLSCMAGFLWLALHLLHLTNNPGGDAVVRIWTAQRWSEHPHYVFYGGWGPLPFYLMGCLIKLTGDTILAPVLLNVGLGVLAIPPFYLFVRKAFGAAYAWAPTLLFCANPVAFRDSLTSMSEPLFRLLLVMAAWKLAHAVCSRRIIFAVLAAVCLGLSTMTRLESVLLIPIFAGMLYKQWKSMLAFIGVAVLHPVLWMVGNHLHYGSALKVFAMASDWQLIALGVNRGITLSGYLQRVPTPTVLFVLVVSPYVFLVCAYGLYLCLRRRERAALWILPTAIMLLLYTWTVVRGNLLAIPRYYGPEVLFLLPFSYPVFQLVGRRLGKAPVALFTGALACLTFTFPFTDLYSLPIVGGRLPRYVKPSRYQELNPVAASTRGYEKLLHVTRSRVELSDMSVICDFFGWHESFHFCWHTRIHPDRIFIAPGARFQVLDHRGFEAFLKGNPKGVLILLRGSRFAAEFEHLADGTITYVLPGVSLQATPLADVPDAVVFRNAPAPLTIYEYEVIADAPTVPTDRPAGPTPAGNLNP